MADATRGIDENENPMTAMRKRARWRNKYTNNKNFKEINGWLEYELPPNLIGKIWKGKFRGQKQKWFIVRFLGNENEINLNTKYPEFIEWKWVNYQTLPNIIVNFKKAVYEKLKIEIKDFIN